MEDPWPPVHGSAGLSILVTGPDPLLGVDEVWRPDGAGNAIRGHMTLDARHRGPQGETSVGGLGVLVDEVLGYSIIASLPARSWTVSTEIWVDLLRPLPTTGRLTASARTVSRGSFAVGRLKDARGEVVAECRERGRRIADAPDFETFPPPASLDAHPTGSGMSDLLGLTLGKVSRLPVVPALENPRRMLHGGISFAACEVVASWSRMQACSTLATTSVHVVHTRGAPFGSVVELDARTVHAGRSLWVTDVTGSVEGRVCVTARVSAQ